MGFLNFGGRSRIVYVLFLILLTTLAYRLVGDNEFIVAFDDHTYITGNPFIHTGINPYSVRWAFTSACCSNWHPLTWMSHMLDCQLYDTRPAGHHLTSLLLHLMNASLLFLLLLRLTGSRHRSLFVAALFALHPLHVESVTFVSERKDVLSTFFLLLTMWAYAGYCENPKPARYMLVIAAYVLGLLSKPMLVSLPLMLLLLDYWPLGRVRLGWKKLIIEKLPFFVLAAASCVVTVWAQHVGKSIGALAQYPFGVRGANAVVAYASYIFKMFWPANLSVFYPHRGTTLPAWQVIGAGLLFAGLSVLAAEYGRKRPYIIMGWLWYVVTLIPVIGLVQVGWQAMADRYTYVPLVGLFIILAWGIPDALASFDRLRMNGNELSANEDRLRMKDGTNGELNARWRVVLAVSAAVVLLALGMRTSQEVGYWQNSEILFKRAIEVTPNNCLANYNLGLLVSRYKRFDEAERYLREALRIGPDSPEIRMSLASNEMALGKLDDAFKNAAAAVYLAPGLAETHARLASVYERRNNNKKAAWQYGEAVTLNPEEPTYQYGLGDALIPLGKLDEAVVHFRAAIKIAPGYVDAYHNLGLVLHYQRKLDQSAKVFRDAIRIKPDMAILHGRLASVLYEKGDYAEASTELGKAEELGMEHDPQFSKALADKMKSANHH